jgi:hypothetical protein
MFPLIRRLLCGRHGVNSLEFTIIMPVFAFLVFSIIELGKVMNYWINLTQIANQGARWVVVARLPDGTSNPSLEGYRNFIASRAGTDELRGLTNVRLCFPSGTGVGAPVIVKVEAQYQPMRFLQLPPITIRSSSSMRIEQPQSFAAGDTTGC